MARAACHLTLPREGAPPLPRDGFSLLPLERQAHAHARRAAYRACASEMQRTVDDVLDKLNQPEFERISGFIWASTREVQQCWMAERTVHSSPPYSEVPAALVHTGCSMADLSFMQQQLLRSLRSNCSPHLATLRSKDCTSLAAAIRSLVSQIVLPTAKCAPGCTFDLSVLAGWYEDLQAGRVTAGNGARDQRAGFSVVVGSEESPTDSSSVLPIVIEDAEHFDTQVLNDLIYALTSARSASGHAPLPIALVLLLPSGAEALQMLLNRSTLVLLRVSKFALATTERTVDQIFSRLLQSVTLPLLHPSVVESILAALSNEHCSSNAMVQQLHYCLIQHFRTNPIAYFIPLTPAVSSAEMRGDKRTVAAAKKRLDESLEVVCTDITLCQLNALYALPSVGNALDESPLARGFDARESVLKSELPKWLQAMGRARVRRACAMRCALSLLQSAFPGGNRHKTSARQLYLDTVDKPLLGACAVVMALKKIRERSAISTSTLYNLLRRCASLLRQAQPLVDRELDAELDALEHIRSSFTSNGHVVQASGATRRSSPPTFANSSSMLLPGQKSHYPSPLTGQPERPSAAKRRRLTLNAVTGATGTIVSSHDRFVEAIIGWFEKMFSAHDVVSKLPLAEVWSCDGTILEKLESAFNPSPLDCLRGGLKNVLTTACSMEDRACGWETAVAYEVLRNKVKERKVDVVDWFELFKSHAVSKRSKLGDGLLLGHFVVALNNLQMLGLTILSKRARGMLEKMVYG